MILDVMVIDGDIINRAKRLNIDHPNGRYELVEYYLPVNGSKTGWAVKANTRPAHFRQLDVNATTNERNLIHTRFLKAHGFSFSNMVPIDMFGYAYLSNDEQEKFWQKFKNNKI